MLKDFLYNLPIFTEDNTPSLENIAENIGLVFDELTQEELAELIYKKLSGGISNGNK